MDTLIEGAYGVRGRFHVVRRLTEEQTPVGMNWLYEEAARVQAEGFDRVRIRVWVGYARRYSTFGSRP